MEPIEIIERDGIVGRLDHDDYPDAGNPRECDQLGIMYCWHPDYTLGDEQFTRDDHDDMDDVVRYLRTERHATCIIPLFLLDHSGLSMRAGSNALDPSAKGRFVGDGAGWDTTHVGFIFTNEDQRKLLGVDADDIERQLRCEVSEYDDYLRGDVYCYAIASADDQRVLDSCCGILGYEHAMAELNASIPSCIRLVERERAEIADWAARDVVTVGAA